MAIIITLLILVVFTLLILVVCFGLYFYRTKQWSLRYQLAKYRLKRQAGPIEGREFSFNAFVSYSSADETWVTTKLLSNLETECGDSDDPFKLCIHERDFKVGMPIADNIVLNLEQSICCILILTESFTQSYWCNFEAHAAHQLFLEQNRIDNLVRHDWSLESKGTSP